MRLTMTGLDSPLLLSNDEIPDPAENGIEYAVLWSANRAGKENRYPSFQDAREILTLLRDRWYGGPGSALHVCGEAGRQQLLQGKLSELTRLVDRIQVNGQLPCEYVSRICSSFPRHQIIQQVHHSNAPAQLTPNHAVLFDPSGGRGKKPDQWPFVDFRGSVGYAGGLSPDNIRPEVEKIRKVCVGDWWIDMESGVRGDDDRFDPELAAAVVAEVVSMRAEEPEAPKVSEAP